MDDGTPIVTSEAQDVDKIFDAEQFLSNFSNLRDECERLKEENQQLQLRLQQMNQELAHSRLEKETLEKHIQQEAIVHKEAVWNLKLETQRSQEERLAWKEKYLDLCIQTSDNIPQETTATPSMKTDKNTCSKKVKKRTSKRLKQETENESTIEDVAAQNSEFTGHVDNSQEQQQQLQQQANAEVEKEELLRQKQLEHIQQQQQHQQQHQQQQQQQNQQQQQQNQQQQQEIERQQQLENQQQLERQQQIELQQYQQLAAQQQLQQQQYQQQHLQQLQVETQHVVNPRSTPQEEALSIETTNPENATSISNVQIVSSMETVDQNHAVVGPQQAPGYYIQPASYDCQGQPVSGNTTTFILQTSDATYCATAVLDDTQRTGAGEGAFTLKAENLSFNSTQAFQTVDDDAEVAGGSESDDNTQFNFRCTLCNFTYSDQEGLEKHVKAKHGAKNVICKQCGKAYSSKSSLAQHVHHYHRHPMAHNCIVCQKKFNRKDFLLKHLKTHTEERDLKCPQCDKAFKTRSALSAHVNGSHNEKRRWVCDFCGMRTSWRLSYIEHMKLHTGEPRKTAARKKQSKQAAIIGDGLKPHPTIGDTLEQLVSEPPSQNVQILRPETII